MAFHSRIEILRRRVLLDPASIAFAALAEEYRRAGRVDDAITICREGLARYPSYLSARVTLGLALIEAGCDADAQTELEAVVQAAPENLAARRGLNEISERQALSGAALSAAALVSPEELFPSEDDPHHRTSDSRRPCALEFFLTETPTARLAEVQASRVPSLEDTHGER